jgi:hypothetical protein
LDELETTVFSRWALGSTSTLTEEMSFANLDPVGGG